MLAAAGGGAAEPAAACVEESRVTSVGLHRDNACPSVKTTHRRVSVVYERVDLHLPSLSQDKDGTGDEPDASTWRG